MHPAAREAGRKFFELYWRPEFRTILDIGSLDVNGTLRMEAPPDATYTGIDLCRGEGVDLVLDDPYSYPFENNSIDAVISTSCFEHDALFWVTFLEMARVVSERGFIYINAPSSWTFHHPPDRWRFYPDAAPALELWSLRVNRPIYLVETCLVLSEKSGDTSEESLFGDNVMIFAKDRDFRPRRYLCDTLFGAEWRRKGSKAPLEYHDTQFWVHPRAPS